MSLLPGEGINTHVVDVLTHAAEERLYVIDGGRVDKFALVEPKADPQVLCGSASLRRSLFARLTHEQREADHHGGDTDRASKLVPIISSPPKGPPR